MARFTCARLCVARPSCALLWQGLCHGALCLELCGLCLVPSCVWLHELCLAVPGCASLRLAVPGCAWLCLEVPSVSLRSQRARLCLAMQECA